jgi:hypothetical protein
MLEGIDMTLDNIHEKELLPKGPEDEIIPTRIAKLDEHRKFLQSQVEHLQKEIADCDIDRELLLKRAKEVRIFEDLEYKIVEVPVYPKKHVDVEALKRLAPEKFILIEANLTEKAKDKLKAQMEKIQISIAQADVKAVISDKALLVQIIPEPTTPSGWTVSIVKK